MRWPRLRLYQERSGLAMSSEACVDWCSALTVVKPLICEMVCGCFGEGDRDKIDGPKANILEAVSRQFPPMERAACSKG